MHCNSDFITLRFYVSAIKIVKSSRSLHTYYILMMDMATVEYIRQLLIEDNTYTLLGKWLDEKVNRGIISYGEIVLCDIIHIDLLWIVDTINIQERLGCAGISELIIIVVTKTSDPLRTLFCRKKGICKSIFWHIS